MPTAANWGYFIYVNLAFFLMVALVFYYSAATEVKKNWAQYRCNPMYMPMSDDIKADFQYCVQNTQLNFMGYILQPLTFMTSNLNANAGAYMGQINDIRAMFDKVRTFLSTIVQSIFGVFLNLIIEFQRVTISIRDLMGKTIGILVTIMYMMDGSVKTMNATWAGPPGQTVRTLGKCFHPDTIVTVRGRGAIKIRDVGLGDIIISASAADAADRVVGTMQFSNRIDEVGYEPLYCVVGAKEGEAPVYVTGSHYVYAGERAGFVEARNVADVADDVGANLLICLMTDTHKIHIGSLTFWDYDDAILRRLH